MDAKIETTRRAGRLLLVLCLILLLLTTASLYFDLRGIDGRYRDLAAEMARSYFRAIDAMREWNLDHGGIYVRADGGISPNPHLSSPVREVTTTAGTKLAMVNHAQMTRLLSELLTDERGIHMHITGLVPIRPENSPDQWEREALADFAGGSEERFEIVRSVGGSYFRYMAPLKTDPRCNSCHDEKHRSNGAVRGGISVSFSYEPFLNVMSAERSRSVFVHVLFFGLGLTLISITGRRLIRSIAALQDSLLRIKRLEGFLPICSRCKNIRLEGADGRRQESWVAIELYIQERTDAEFTHGLCPRCAHELYPEISLERKS